MTQKSAVLISWVFACDWFVYLLQVLWNIHVTARIVNGVRLVAVSIWVIQLSIWYKIKQRGASVNTPRLGNLFLKKKRRRVSIFDKNEISITQGWEIRKQINQILADWGWVGEPTGALQCWLDSTVGTWLYCDYFIWCVTCTVVVWTYFVMCGCV